MGLRLTFLSLLIGTAFLADAVRAEESACLARFRELLVPRLPASAWRSEGSPHEGNHYRELYERIRRGELSVSSEEAVEEANRIAWRELEEMGFPVAGIPQLGELRITQELLKDRARTSSPRALEHPRLPAYLRELERVGGRLLIRPEVTISQAPDVFLSGVCLNTSPATLVLAPNASWETFVHEYQHFVFNHLGLVEKTWNDPAFLRELRRRDAPLRFGLKPKVIAREVAAFAKQGASNRTVNEALAVKAEIRELYRQGYAPWSAAVYQRRSYAWKFEEKELRDAVARGSATPEQKKALEFLQAKKFLLHPRVLGPLVAAGAGTLFLFREETGELLVAAKDGVWQAFELFSSPE